MAASYSGLQRSVLALYRACLRAIRSKPRDTRQNWLDFTRFEFQQHRHVDRKDFNTIEFLLRKGRRQLDMYAAANVTNITG